MQLSTPRLRFKVRSLSFAVNVVQKICVLTVGRMFVSSFGKRLRGLLVRSFSREAIPQLNLAVVVHAFYPELLREALDCRAQLPEGTPLIVTVPPRAYDTAAHILRDKADVDLIQLPNRGRDIAPFIALLNSGKLDPFDAVLKLHTKRSPHLRDGDIRRKLLFAMLCGNPRATRRALTAFHDAHVGMVGWGGSYRKRRAYWMGNQARVIQLAHSLKVNGSAQLGFFEGSMFWVRPKALAPLRRLDLCAEDFEAEAGQLDGTLHHAIERCFTIAVWSAGFTVRDLRGGLLTGVEIGR